MSTRQEQFDDRSVMGILAHSDAKVIARHLERIDVPDDWSFVRRPETGLVMVRGRMGGQGGPFNFGEVTVTRAVVALKSGETGFSYALGRDREKAQNSALVHALWKTADQRMAIERDVLRPLETAEAEADTKVREETASTKVDFFTLVRGDD